MKSSECVNCKIGIYNLHIQPVCKYLYEKGYRSIQWLRRHVQKTLASWSTTSGPLLATVEAWISPKPHCKTQVWTSDGRDIQTGDLVLIAEDNVPRGMWTLSRVVRPIQGSDGRVRSAEVNTALGQKTRPTIRLCVLEQEQWWFSPGD